MHVVAVLIFTLLDAEMQFANVDMVGVPQVQICDDISPTESKHKAPSYDTRQNFRKKNPEN